MLISRLSFHKFDIVYRLGLPLVVLILIPSKWTSIRSYASDVPILAGFKTVWLNLSSVFLGVSASDIFKDGSFSETETIR